MDYQLLGLNIRNHRVELGWTQERLAREIGVSTSFIGHIERGSRTASLDTLVLLCNAMDLSADQLLGANLQRKVVTVDEESRSEQCAAMNELLSDMQRRVKVWGTEA